MSLALVDRETGEIVDEFAILNELEVAAARPEVEASGIRWRQAEQVVALLASGKTQRQVAAGWKKSVDSTYGHVHVGYVARAWSVFGHLGDQRPMWNEAYHSDEVRKRGKGQLPGLEDDDIPIDETAKTLISLEDAEPFTTIAIDPPWRYGNTATRAAAEDHYPTMSIEEIAALPIPAAENAHMYLWVTNGFLREGFDLLDAWDFTYKTCITWCKTQIGLGNYFRNATEHVYFATRGSLATRTKNERTWFEAERSVHSRKPHHFYELVQRNSPGPFLEMFARRPRPGWTVWGNEV